MTKNELLDRFRQMADHDRETLAIWKEHNFRFRTNGQDTTEKDLEDFAARIASLEDLIRRIEAADA